MGLVAPPQHTSLPPTKHEIDRYLAPPAYTLLPQPRNMKTIDIWPRGPGDTALPPTKHEIDRDLAPRARIRYSSTHAA